MGAIVGAVVGILVVMVVVVVVVFHVKRKGAGVSKDASHISFENPMYESSDGNKRTGDA